MNIEVLGVPSIIAIGIKENNPLVLKTIFTKEMLKRGYLVSTVIYVSYAHKKKIVDKYLNDVEEVFKYISKHKNNLEKVLDNEISHSGFQRLN